VELRESRILAGVIGDGTWFSLFRWLMSASGAFGSLPGAALALAGVPLAALVTGTRALASASREVGMVAALRPRAPTTGACAAVRLAIRKTFESSELWRVQGTRSLRT
jgi:hypothetical protein